ncbi:MAG TPA: ABC transporter ATP-binding protein [Anaerolineae bacterium]|nr:ABC transporter ATP-binding protein [Anaerolineae bacterium]
MNANQESRIANLELTGITKHFPGVLANDQVDFDVHAGEVHALLGENGAGKTTLMRILYGLYQADEGEIRINGQPVQIRSPHDAIAHGIGMVHQHFMLVPTLTVTENVILGLPSSRAPFLDSEQAARRIAHLSETYGLKVDPNAYVWQLSVGEQQRVEIIKALFREASLLILDEPTAVLTPQEVEELFGVLREFTAHGLAVIFITHKLHEVMAISDRVTVLRAGRRVATLPTSETNPQALAELMVGRQLQPPTRENGREPGDLVLTVENLSALGDKGVPALRDVSLDVRAGEIVGLAGVSGNGQRELAEVIAGLRRPTSGQVLIEGKDVTGRSPTEMIQAGLAYIPEERLTVGTIPDFSVAENAILEVHGRPPLARGIFLNTEAVRRFTQQLIEQYDVKTPTQETPIKKLSGGNIQKLILARELSRNPKLLIAAQPTRGLDVGATEYIHHRLLEERANGTAILLISEDLDEIFALSDRIAVMYEGRIMGIVPIAFAQRETIGLMMAGVHE